MYRNKRIAYINEETLGEGAEAEARRMVELMRAKGWDVEYGTDMRMFDRDEAPYYDNEYEADFDECLDWVAGNVNDATIAELNSIMTASEAAQVFGLSESTVRQACNRNDIPHRKSAGTWLIRRADAEAQWGWPEITGYFCASGGNGSYYIVETDDGSVEVDTVNGSANVEGEWPARMAQWTWRQWADWAHGLNDAGVPNADPALYGWDSTEQLMKHLG